MTISSRTPEGLPNSCPVCSAPVCIEPSQPPGDAPCPGCGTLLWFVRTSSGMRFHEAAAFAHLRERLAEIVRHHPSVRQESDSLDIVELVMAMEEEFRIAIGDDDAENIRTVEDMVDYIIENGLQ